jgi:hypothetical protein
MKAMKFTGLIIPVLVASAFCAAYYFKDFENMSGTTLGHDGVYGAVPKDESMVACLVRGEGAVFYGGTQAVDGKPAWLFRGDVAKKDVHKVFCIKKVLPGQSRITSLVRDDKTGTVYGSTRNLRKGNWLPEFDFQEISTDIIRDSRAKDIRPPARHVFSFKAIKKVNDLGIAVKGEGVYGIIYDSATKALYGITDHWKIFRFDLKSRKIRIIHDLLPVPKHEERSRFAFFGKKLIMDAKGAIWGTGQDGEFFIINTNKNVIEYQDIFLPSIRGREQINGVQSWVMGPDNIIYGGASADGILFSFDPEKRECSNLGTPHYSVGIPGIAVNSHGIVYIAAGNFDTKTHLFAYDSKKHKYIDFGVPHFKIPKSDYSWRSFHIGPMLFHVDNVLVFGNRDRWGHIGFYSAGTKLPGQQKFPAPKK